MNIMLNGEARQIPSTPYTVFNLLTELGYIGKRIAVELNGDIVPKSQHETRQLNDGDSLEIVVAVGGG
ncbi:sulfur carrier protein ThiS [Paenalcaligenes niemegkensis]|uniref:sulfur carrier protein ThiS n=1 Tax=Paenalcaligenes niemegkensis TaxID=2895469 RepID=UPI001EE96C44|nr:sulfur carrier protein ThiS [Paenalcaligenes niemegkensis]MCQ9617409.1 sulfur carrier protein ThiS [Paenalcaligenes niemegkensis]